MADDFHPDYYRSEIAKLRQAGRQLRPHKHDKLASKMRSHYARWILIDRRMLRNAGYTLRGKLCTS